MQVADRLKSIPPYVFVELNRKAQAAIARGIDVINLGIGDPDQPTPPHVVAAMHKAIDNPANHKYPPFGGMKEYKEAAANWCSKRFGFVQDAGCEITSLIGSKEGIHNLIMAYVNPGDVVLVPDPAYPVYRSSTLLAGGTPVFMSLLPENNFLPDLSAIPKSAIPKAKLMLLNYPNNPTAGVANLDFFKKAVQFCKQHNILLCHDLAYSEMTFDGYKAPSIFEIPEAKDIAIELHSLSKTYNMTGWRIGFAIGNKEVIKALAQLKSNIDTDVFRAIQLAAVAAFTGPTDHIHHCNQLYMERRDLAVTELKKLGWNVKPNLATFYMWLPVPDGLTSSEFSSLMLDKVAILVPPGTAYGPSGEGYFRMSLCTDKSRLKEAFERMAKHSIAFSRVQSKV